MWTNYWIIRPELPDNKDTDFNLNGEISGLPLSLIFGEEVAHLTVAGGHDDHGDEIGQQKEDNVVDIVQH